MKTALNTPQRHGSVPLAQHTPTLELSSRAHLGSRADLLEQAAKTPSAWPQGRGETGKLAFIKSIPNGWAAEREYFQTRTMQETDICLRDHRRAQSYS